MTTYSSLNRGKPLKRGPGPKRKTVLGLRSKKAKAQDKARAACREEVLERDESCVFHRIVAQLDGRSICDGWGGRLQVHEVQTRARRGSITDPSNCVAICNWANTIWLTSREAGAETLGLLLPSTASDGDKEWAKDRREALLQGYLALTPPPWRTGEPEFLDRVIRDLGTLGIKAP